jgi:multidrug efflux pump subunit AcrA (membrane-fusion protein)
MNIKSLPKFLKIIIIIAILIGAGLGIKTLFFTKKSTPTYTTDTAVNGTLIITLTESGQVAATNSRTVTTTASGVVSKVYVKEGQKVSAGTPIMQITLDLDGLQQFQQASASYQSAQNNLASAQSRLYSLQSAMVTSQNIFNNQYSQLSPDDPSYIQYHDAFLSAQAAYNQQQAVIAQAQTSLISARLSYQAAGPTVVAPIAGTVSAISLGPGMILNPTSSSANSTNASNKIAIVKTGATPAITVSLTEIDVPKVKVGNQATITFDSFPNETYTGKIIAVDTSGTVSSGVVSYPTTIQLDNDVAKILSNMTATANIITEVKDNVILVPSTAVQTSSSTNTTTVRELQNGQLVNVPATVGDSNDTQTEIISGVSAGDTVVTAVTNPSTPKTSSTSTSVFGNTRGGFGAALGR